MNNFNSVQTQITTELLEELPKDVVDSLNDHLENIEFIRNLINPNRKFAKDLDRDEEGKILVNITNPHILEDTDYFRPLAIEFEMNGKYTSIFPNPARTSEYRKFWDEQRDRCINGYVRESDGEWIPGSFYFYLNFCRIPVAVAKTTKQKPSKKNKRSKAGKTVEADRVLKHPDFWDGDYLYYHYLDQAKKAGKHANVLKTRGRGFSFKGGEMLAEGYFFYDNSNNYAVAAHENFLTNDGLLTKAWDIIDDININTPFTKTALPKSPMKRVASYVDANGNIRGTKSAVIGISLKNDIEKHRGKRGRIMLFEESGVFPKLNTAWDIARNSFEQDDLVFGLMISFGCVCKGTKVYTNKGEYINIEDLQQPDGIVGFGENNISKEPIVYMQPPAKKECVRITTSYRTLECSIDHPILIRTTGTHRKGFDKVETYFSKKTRHSYALYRI